jgi:hypothetical protein
LKTQILNQDELTGPDTSAQGLKTPSDRQGQNCPANTPEDQLANGEGGEILLDLRAGWLTDAADPDKQVRKPPTWKTNLREELVEMAGRMVLLLDFIDNLMSVFRPVRKKRTMGSRLVSVLLFGLVIAGVLLYLAKLKHHFDAVRLASTLTK